MALSPFAIGGIVVGCIIGFILLWAFFDALTGRGEELEGGFRKKMHRVKNRNRNRNRK